jgi:integrase
MWVAEQQRRAATGQIAPATLRLYGVAARYWTDAIGEIRLAALVRSHVADALSSWLASGVAQRTCEHALRVLRIALDWGHARGAPRPPELDRLLRVDREARVNNGSTPSRADVDAILRAIPAGEVRDLVELLSITGCRIGEAAAARVADFDHDAMTLTLHGRDAERGTRGKAKPRRFPVTDRLGALLERRVAGRPRDERLFTAPRLERVALAALAKAARSAGVPACTPHGLRRFVATSLLDAGVDARTVSELTGHSVAILLGVYVRPTPDRLREAVGRMVDRPKVLDMRRRREEG